MRFILYTSRESSSGNRVTSTGYMLCSAVCIKAVVEVFLNNESGTGSQLDFMKFTSSPLANCTRCYNCSNIMPCENDSPRAQACLLGDECHRYPTLTDTLGMEE